MPAINQRIPNFIGGVSQQPDTLKFPGQVRVCDNAVPDVTFGLMKRPPGEFVKALGSNANDTGYWYDIIRDGDEKYLVQITPASSYSGTKPIRVWNLLTGVEQSLTNGNGDSLFDYLKQSGTFQRYATQTIQDTTIISNPQKTVNISGVTDTPLNSGNYSFARLETVAHNTEYTLYTSADPPANNKYWRATAMKVEFVRPTTAQLSADISGQAAWAASTKYVQGDYVTSDSGKVYQCSHDHSGNHNHHKATSSSNSSHGPTGTGEWIRETGSDDGWGGNNTMRWDYKFPSTTDNTTKGNTWISADDENKFMGLGQFSFAGGNDITLTTKSGTYSRSGSIITVTCSSHGYSVGDRVYIDFTSGGLASEDDDFTITSTATNSFNVIDNNSGSTSGNCTVRIAVEDLEGFVTVNGASFVSMQNPNVDGYSNSNDGWMGYTQTYHTEYSAQITIKDGGIIKTQSRAAAEALTIDLVIEGHIYRLSITSVEPYETYEGVPGIAYYKTPREPGKGKLGMSIVVQQLFNAVNNHLADVTAEVVGNGLYLYGTKAKDVNFQGGGVNEAVSLISTTAQNVARLPAQCKDGYITQISNSDNTESDNYYLKFIADNGTKGPGKWEECARPHNFSTASKTGTYTRSGTTITVNLNSHGNSVGDRVYIDFTSGAGVDGEYLIKTSATNSFTVTDTVSGTISSSNCTVSTDYMLLGLDPATMPHGLVNNRDGTFTFKQLNEATADADGNDLFWKTRGVGDKDTNPFPSFYEKEIQQVFFHRNRLGLIADEQVVLSRPGDYFNFFIVSAITTSDDNPVDITVSDTKPAFINHVLPINKGVMLFSDNGQHMLFTESDLFTPKTARLKKVASYECDASIQPLDMGSSVMFTSNVSAYTRAYEATIIDDDLPVKMLEQTRVVPEYVPKQVDTSAVSTSLGIVTFGTKNSSDIYHFKFFDSGEKREQSSWYSWTLTGTLQHHLYTAGSYYAITKQGSDYMLCRYEYVADANSNRTYALGSGTVGSSTTTSRWFEACLDNMTIPTAISYTAQGASVTGPDFTDLTIPYTPTSASNFYAVALSGTDTSGNNVAGTVVKADSVGTNKATFLNIDMTGWTIAVGYSYTTTIELPNYYAAVAQNQYDLDGDLRVSGFNFEMGVSGPMEFHLSSTYADMSDYIQYESGMKLDDSDFGKPPAKLMKSVRVPIQKKNEKYKLTIKVPDPFSTALISGSWDGIYNQRRHARR